MCSRELDADSGCLFFFPSIVLAGCWATVLRLEWTGGIGVIAPSRRAFSFDYLVTRCGCVTIKRVGAAGGERGGVGGIEG